METITQLPQPFERVQSDFCTGTWGSRQGCASWKNKTGFLPRLLGWQERKHIFLLTLAALQKDQPSCSCFAIDHGMFKQLSFSLPSNNLINSLIFHITQSRRCQILHAAPFSPLLIPLSGLSLAAAPSGHQPVSDPAAWSTTHLHLKMQYPTQRWLQITDKIKCRWTLTEEEDIAHTSHKEDKWNAFMAYQAAVSERNGIYQKLKARKLRVLDHVHLTIKMLSKPCVVRSSALWEGPILIFCVSAFCTHIFFVNCKTGKIWRKPIPPPPAICLAV